METEGKVKIIRGDRICRGVCRGYCHDGSWRTKIRPYRQMYFHSEWCLRGYYQAHDWPEEVWKDFLKRFERVDVIENKSGKVKIRNDERG